MLSRESVLRGMLDAATPGPWLVDGGRIHLAPDERTAFGWTVALGMTTIDALLVAALHAAAPALLDVAEAAHDFVGTTRQTTAAQDAFERLAVALLALQALRVRP